MAATPRPEITTATLERALGAGRTVHVVVPAQIAFNLDRMQTVTREILGRLGCDKCHSGWDIRFRLETDFIVDEQGKVRGGLGPIGG